MTWLLYRWAWQLESPLFIGAPPAGPLNGCRLYIPARAFWGALAGEIARLRSQAFPDYEAVGGQLKEKTRLTYLYPAERGGGDWRTWLPQYKEGLGLCWRREDRGLSERDDREFRGCLLDVRPATAIDPDSGSAADGSLRETECIQANWRDGATPASRVAMVGHVFLSADDQLRRDMERLDYLFVGGDTRYGLGRVRRVGYQEAQDIFGMRTRTYEEKDPIVEAGHVLGHAVSLSPMSGAHEVLAGWDRPCGDRLLPLSRKSFWTPGSVSDNKKAAWAIDKDGVWHDRLGLG